MAPPMPRGGDLMSESVVTRSEAGKRGYEALLATYGTKQLNRWRRQGGRKKHRTLAEINAEARETASTKRRRVANHSIQRRTEKARKRLRANPK